ncbi:MAG TPA: hypothetical protein VIY48_22040 [Candidatus Paceibacterota bacterium]
MKIEIEIDEAAVGMGDEQRDALTNTTFQAVLLVCNPKDLCLEVLATPKDSHADYTSAVLVHDKLGDVLAKAVILKVFNAMTSAERN